MSTADAPAPVAPRVAGPAPRVLLVRAPYYREVVDGLTDGARRILDASGALHDMVDVAGSFELPQAIALVARSKHPFDGFVALGCIIRGGTDHYDYICRETMGGLMQVALRDGLCLGSGVLTVHSHEQARVRAGLDGGGANKGAEAAAAALGQIAVRRRFHP